MPASTSSNTRVGGAAVSTTRSASIARASSPPEAARARARAGSPGLGARRKVTSSAPSSPAASNALREWRERLPTGERRDRFTQRVLRAVFERGVGGVECFTVGLGVGEDLLLGRQRRVLVRVVDRGGVDLVELVPQQVDLACA